MNLLIKLTVFLCFFTLGQVETAAILHDRGVLLCMFGNQPHRGIGMLYVAKLLQPQRSDYEWDYYTQYLKFFENQMILEGSTVPVIPMEIVQYSRGFYNDPDMQRLRSYVMYRSLKGDYDNMHGYKEEKK